MKKCVLIIVATMLACDPSDDDEDSCPDIHGERCSLPIEASYKCDSCGNLWACYRSGDYNHEVWNFTGKPYPYVEDPCDCLVDGSWDYVKCPMKFYE
jgi:hypothetical protein